MLSRFPARYMIVIGVAVAVTTGVTMLFVIDTWAVLAQPGGIVYRFHRIRSGIAGLQVSQHP